MGRITVVEPEEKISKSIYEQKRGLYYHYRMLAECKHFALSSESKEGHTFYGQK